MDSKRRKGQVTCMRGKVIRPAAAFASTGGNIHGCGMTMKEEDQRMQT